MPPCSVALLLGNEITHSVIFLFPRVPCLLLGMLSLHEKNIILKYTSGLLYIHQYICLTFVTYSVRIKFCATWLQRLQYNVKVTGRIYFIIFQKRIQKVLHRQYIIEVKHHGRWQHGTALQLKKFLDYQ